MPTIVRDRYGLVNITATVCKTISYLVNTQAGFYTVVDIQNKINDQLKPHEHISQKKIRRAIVSIFSKSNN